MRFTLSKGVLFFTLILFFARTGAYKPNFSTLPVLSSKVILLLIYVSERGHYLPSMRLASKIAPLYTFHSERSNANSHSFIFNKPPA